MSSTDNTRDKLVASMRKTKTGTTAAAGQPAPAAKKAAPASKKAATRKPAARPQTTPRKPAAKAAATGGDPFQAGRRIWPD